MNLLVSLLSVFNLMFLGVHTDSAMPAQTVQATVVEQSSPSILLNAETTAIIRFSALDPIHKGYHAIESNGTSVGQLGEMLNSYSADGDTFLFSD
jgi:hypothetical protein